MSFTFIPPHQKPPNSPDIREIIKKMLDENSQLLQIIHESQMRGKISDCIKYQKVLHRNILYLAKLADSNSNEHTSLPAQGNQPGSGSINEINQIQPTGQSGNLEQVSNQSYGQQQGHFPMQSQQMVNQQSILPHNQSLVPQSITEKIFQSSIEQITNQQPMVAQKHSVILGHPLEIVQDSTSGTASSGSDYVTITNPMRQQGLEYSNQQGYLQLQGYSQHQQINDQQQQVNGQQQYSQSGLDSASKHGQYMPDQQNQISSQLYSPCNWQQGVIGAEGVLGQQQQGNI